MAANIEIKARASNFNRQKIIAENNSKFIRPSNSEIIRNQNRIEGGCYW